MSISPIREAVRQLEALGLAKHVPHQGARVLDFDIDELRDLFEVRLALESLAVRRAAERFTEADAAAARGHLDRLDERAARGRPPDDARAHGFHFTLYEASQSPWLVSLIRPAWDAPSASGPPSSRRRTSRRCATASWTGACWPRARSTTPAAAADALYEAPRAGEPLLRDRARRRGHLRARRLSHARRSITQLSRARHHCRQPQPGRVREARLDAPAAEVLRDGDDQLVRACASGR